MFLNICLHYTMHESLPSFRTGIKKQDWIALAEQANEQLFLEKSTYCYSSVMHSTSVRFLQGIFSERDQNQSLLFSWARGITALHPHVINQLKARDFFIQLCLPSVSEAKPEPTCSSWEQWAIYCLLAAAHMWQWWPWPKCTTAW